MLLGRLVRYGLAAAVTVFVVRLIMTSGFVQAAFPSDVSKAAALRQCQMADALFFRFSASQREQCYARVAGKGEQAP